MSGQSPVRNKPRLTVQRLVCAARDRSGATAVEFAIVAAPLLFLIFAILELSQIFTISAALENATNEAARTIRTGSVQTAGGGDATSFRNAICAKLNWIGSSCQNNLSIDVRTFSQFSNPTAPDPVSNGSFNNNALTYSPGSQGSIVLVRAFYRWTLLTPYFSGGFQRLNGGVTLMTSSTIFRNEPY